MRILHVTAIISLDGKSGIPAVVKGLCEYQNKLNGIESRVLSLRARVDNVESPYFYYIGDCHYMQFLSDYNPDIVIIHDF